MPLEDSLLIIFIKNPEKGKVKTRLAKDMGDDNALEIYQQLLNHTRQIASKVETHRHVYYSDSIDANDNWNDSFEKHQQHGKDLGERMQNAFTFAFMRGYEKVVIIGSDCISLTEQTIADAFMLLENNEVVIGPAKDGGYYLLGMRHLLPQLFQEVDWGSDGVLRQTLSKLSELNILPRLLPALSDIDTLEDFISHKHLFPA